MTDQSLSVYNLTAQHGDLHYDRWRHVEVPFASMSNAPATISALDSLESQVVQKQQQLAMPVTHHFEVVLNP